MKTVGIVAEYNPFHNGHAWHISESRRRFGEDTAVAVVMSGDFVQRGEAAVYSKFARAEAACRCGADLIVELPLPWCVASAEGFARAALYILSSLGTEVLSFGSETEKLEEMEEVAELVRQEDFLVELRQQMKQIPTQGFAVTRQILAEQRLGKLLPWMRLPNSILGLEYLKAIREGGLNMSPCAVMRRGVGHDAAGYGHYSSASELRSRLKSGESIEKAVPVAAGEVFRRERDAGRQVSDLERYDLMILSRLRFLRIDDFLQLPDAGDGLAERLFEAVHREKELEAVVRSSVTRHFPLSRIRRQLLCAALGITAKQFAGMPPYIRVLAFSETGKEWLHNLRKTSLLPVLTKPAHVRDISPEAGRVFECGAVAHDLYTLCYSLCGVQACGEDWRKGPSVILSEKR